MTIHSPDRLKDGRSSQPKHAYMGLGSRGRHLVVLVAAGAVLFSAALLGPLPATSAGAETTTLPTLPGDTSSSTSDSTTTSSSTSTSTTSTTVRPTTTTTSAPRTTTTTEYIPEGEPDQPAQTAPASSSTQDGGQAGPQANAGSSASGGEAAWTTGQPPPPPLFPAMESYDAPPGPRSTRDVLELLERIHAGPAAIARVLAPFPVAGPASYSDDWNAPRTYPTPHLHEGCDIFAARGTPVLAVAQGRVTDMRVNTDVGGTTLHLLTGDGTYFYYAHLDGFAPFLYDGTLVAQGDVLGYVGNTGDADGGPTHLHFEVHPHDGDAVPPVPYLDHWLDDARRRARELAGVEDTRSNDLPVIGPAADAGAAVVSGAASVARTVLTRAAAVTTPPSSASAAEPLFGIAVLLGLAWLFTRRGRARAEHQPFVQPHLGATPGSNKEDT